MGAPSNSCSYRLLAHQRWIKNTMTNSWQERRTNCAKK
uniref:Uncharacterized protein n=1 Tax=Arundo donax TaxID=35708 RepID=A0A0A9PTI8_ARUDO